MRSIADLMLALVKAGVSFPPERDAEGRVVIRIRMPWPAAEAPPEVRSLLRDLRRRYKKASDYMLTAKVLGEVTSLRGERLRVHRARPICVLANTCWRSVLGCELSPETTEFGWTKRCREKAPVRKAETPRTKARGGKEGGRSG